MTKQKRKRVHLWEMTQRQFYAAGRKGRIVKATGKVVPGEKKARTALKLGELKGYRVEDIAHIYLHAHRNYLRDKAPAQCAYAHMIVDAIHEKRTVPRANAEVAVRVLERVMRTQGYIFLPSHPPKR